MVGDICEILVAFECLRSQLPSVFRLAFMSCHVSPPNQRVRHDVEPPDVPAELLPNREDRSPSAHMVHESRESRFWCVMESSMLSWLKEGMAEAHASLSRVEDAVSLYLLIFNPQAVYPFHAIPHFWKDHTCARTPPRQAPSSHRRMGLWT